MVGAVIRDERGRILLTRRPEGRHMAGLWEFPGGKIERGETPQEALVRELEEELGVVVAPGRTVGTARHEESGLVIDLRFLDVAIVHGTPRPLDGQEIAWVEPEALNRHPMPPADEALVATLQRADPAPDAGNHDHTEEGSTSREENRVHLP